MPQLNAVLALLALLLTNCSHGKPGEALTPPRLEIDDAVAAREALSAALQLIEADSTVLALVLPHATPHDTVRFFASVREVVRPENTSNDRRYLLVDTLLTRGSDGSLSAQVVNGPLSVGEWPWGAAGYLIMMSRGTDGKWTAHILTMGVG